jgi:hypothetical protein
MAVPATTRIGIPATMADLVVTDLDDWAGQSELSELLRTWYCVHLRRPDAIVYDLRMRCGAGPPGSG